MATEGPRFPGTTATLANAGTSENAEAWVNPGNVVSDNGTEATITAATYDSPDISQILVASNFGFTATTGTVDGITVEIDRRSIIASSGKDFRVQLAKGTAFANLVGSNLGVPATIWPTTTAVATYGGVSNLWGTTWTAAEVKASSFAVFVSCQANIANADVGIDFIRVTITYTDASVTASPTASSLTLSAGTPTVATTANQFPAPTAASLTLSVGTPTVATTDHKTALPTSASLTLSAGTPTVTATDHKSASPTVAALTLSLATPTVATTDNIIAEPSAATLTLSVGTPELAVTDHKTSEPTPATLTATGFAPTVTATEHQTALPTAAALTLTAFVPDVVATDPKMAIPEAASLTLSLATPFVEAAEEGQYNPPPATLVLSTASPTVTYTDHKTVVPTSVSLILTGLTPSVTVGPAGSVELPAKVNVGVTITSSVVTIEVTDGPDVEVLI